MRASALALLACALGAAATASAAVADAAGTGVSAATVVVIGNGTEQRAFDTPFAVSVVGAEELRSAGPLVNLSEALGRVPGLVVNLRNNYAQDLQISSRGFGARASFGVRGLRLVADGIPAAGPDGQGQVSHFDLAGAERIEVLRGPFSALYGSSSGGVIALVSRAPGETLATLDADAGSNGLRQARLTLATPLPGGFSLRASASHFEVDGLRPHSQARRSLAHARLGYDAAADRVVLVLNHLEQPAQDPLGLTRAQFEQDPDQTTTQATQFNTRKNTRQDQAGVQWQHRFADAGALQRATLAAYTGTRGVTQWQAIAPATQANLRHPGGVIDFDRRYQGLDARLAWRWDTVRLTTGASSDRQTEARRGYENFIGSGATQQLGLTGRLRRDEENRARSADVYAQAEVDLTAAWTASLGWRQGRLKVDSSDRYFSNGDDSGALAFSYRLPVLGLRWQPAAAWSVYASAGRGHESPTLNELAYRPDGNPGFNSALRAQRSTQVELGAKWRAPQDEATLELAVFEARTQDEIGTLSNAGGRATFQNIGRTQRRGAELSASARLADAWRTRLALSTLRATVDNDFFACAGTPCSAPTVPVPAGRRIAGTLPRSAWAELAWEPTAGRGLALEVRGQGRQAVNDANSDFAAGHGLLALRAHWAWPLGAGQLQLLGRIDNLADRRIAGSVIVNEGNQRFFEPAAGRHALVSARWVQRF